MYLSFNPWTGKGGGERQVFTQGFFQRLQFFANMLDGLNRTENGKLCLGIIRSSPENELRAFYTFKCVGEKKNEQN